MVHGLGLRVKIRGTWLGWRAGSYYRCCGRRTFPEAHLHRKSRFSSPDMGLS